MYIAFSNGGGIRAGLKKGHIDTAMVSAMLPFKNEVRFAVANGTVIEHILEHSVALNTPAGRFLSIDGLRFWYDPNLNPGSRVSKIEVHYGLLKEMHLICSLKAALQAGI